MPMNPMQGGALGPAPAQAGPQAAPEAQPAPGPQGPPSQGAPQGGPGAAPQIDQKRMMEAARAASAALYDKAVFDKMVEMAKQNPVPAIMNTTVRILTKVDEAVPGMIIDEVFGVGMMLVVDAADALQQGGIPVNEEQVSQALSDGITLFLQSNPQRFAQGEVEDAMARLQEGVGQMDTGEAAPAAPPGGPAPGGALGQMGGA